MDAFDFPLSHGSDPAFGAEDKPIREDLVLRLVPDLSRMVNEFAIRHNISYAEMCVLWQLSIFTLTAGRLQQAED